ncbi:MAG: lamin tail domain-containing protein, partial [Deltaproteobacteria bacterium]|nr:lamin tail domain-containing protein [Deltaproteobacteria bacterium]
CANGADDDCDGVQDCADPDCAAAAACEGESCQTPFQMNGGAAVSAGDLPLELVETGDNTNAAPDLTGSCDADTAAAVDHVYRLVLDGPAIATISHDYAGTSMWPAVYVFEGECLAGAQIACAKAMGGAAIIADLSLGAGTYFIVVDSSWGTDMGPYTLTVGLAAPADVEDICNDGVDNEGDGLADCDDPDCGEDICGPEQLPWTETFTYMPGDVIKGGIWNSEGDCGWTVTATLTPPNGFAEFAYAFGCSETEPYWIAGAILDVQGCGEISVTFDESGVDSEYAVYHSLAVFDGFDLVDEIELPTTGITGTWTASGPHVFDVTGHDFIRVAAGYMGDFADTWRMDNVVVQCTALTEICDDSQDNDGDNAVDCDDPDCADHLACLGEDCALAIPVRDTPVVLADAGVLLSFTGNTTDFAADYAGFCSSASAAAKDVVYSMTLADRMKVTVTHDFTGTFNYSSVYLFGGDAASCNSGVTLACHNGNSGVSTFTKTLDPGVYYIVVDANWGTDAGPYTFTVAFAAPPPTSETGLCADGLDNDGDTVKDCLDLPDCATDPACVDGDGDGVPDVADECPGGDDTVDADNNGIPDACEIDWAGEVWPLSGASFDDGDAIDVYVQVFKAGVTEPAGQGAGIEVALFYQSASAPAPASLPMAYNVDINNNDEYKATIPASASVGGEELDIWFEVTFVVGDGGNVYDGDVKDQADAFPIAYVITIDMTPNLFFSEYVEGGSFNKAVEILNAGSVTVDLKDCVILRYSNGSGTSANVFVTPAATPTPLAPGGLWVVCHPSIATPLVCDHTTSELNHNGNDALALSCNGVVMDFFGRAPDPTTPMVDAWTNGAGTVSTKDMTLRRKCTVTAGETTGADVFDPSVEWVAYAKDDLTNLGVDHCL